MAGLRLYRASTEAPDVLTADDYNPEPVSRVSCGDHSEGDVLVLRCRQAHCFINATTLPAWRAWEGPFLRIQPHTHVGSAWQDGVARYAQASTWSRGAVCNAEGTDFFAQGVDGISYDIDAMCSSPIVLPFSCSTMLWTGLSGHWMFDLYVTKQARLPNAPAAPRTYPHTRRLGRTAASRVFAVPAGAIDAFSGGAPLNGFGPLSSVEDTAKSAAGGTSFLSSYTPVATAYQGGHISIGGARTWTLQADGVGNVFDGVYTQFNIQLG